MPENPEQPGKQDMEEFGIKWKDLRKHAEDSAINGGSWMFCKNSKPI